jgi:mannose/fructose-specific phosphotransferase system component IIA
MTAIVVCSHAELAQGFLSAAEMISGEQEQLFALGFRPGEDLAGLIARIAGCIEASGADRALVFADLFGASPPTPRPLRSSPLPRKPRSSPA